MLTVYESLVLNKVYMEGLKDLSDEEINRCLEGTVARIKNTELLRSIIKQNNIKNTDELWGLLKNDK